MSNQGYYQGPPDHQNQQGLANNNPWADQVSQQEGQPPQQPFQQQQQQPPQQQQQYSAPAGYDAPPGPPPRRTGTFQETQFVPEAERGEQREAMEQFEMSRSQPEGQTERDVAALQEEFPGLDGSLIAAIYGDSQSMGATREMLQALASK